MKKMKKLNQNGFILSETLVVSVFLMVMFTMIYTNFYPLIGEYEKRENYDDADGKYAAYWIKKIIESDAYQLYIPADAYSYPADKYTGEEKALIDSSLERIHSMNEYGYMRFQCSDVSSANSQRELCASLVNSFEISGCDRLGDNCDIFITNYRIGTIGTQEITPNFKKTVRNAGAFKYLESCKYRFNAGVLESEPTKDCKDRYFKSCCVKSGIEDATLCNDSSAEGDALIPPAITEDFVRRTIQNCINKTKVRTFTSGMKDYILSLPNYRFAHNTTGAKYRIIIVRHHTKDKNNYYSYATMEVIKSA